ncbi:hypothetical protein K440DRAFT_187664 [Wilcoxina mikolae CBS 423.85]|nr:hypothetical protein K440DRAFT_187664 [Wilcoxina mikolae CBS 423.85]
MKSKKIILKPLNSKDIYIKKKNLPFLDSQKNPNDHEFAPTPDFSKTQQHHNFHHNCPHPSYPPQPPPLKRFHTLRCCCVPGGDGGGVLGRTSCVCCCSGSSGITLITTSPPPPPAAELSAFPSNSALSSGGGGGPSLNIVLYSGGAASYFGNCSNVSGSKFPSRCLPVVAVASGLQNVRGVDGVRGRRVTERVDGSSVPTRLRH